LPLLPVPLLLEAEGRRSAHAVRRQSPGRFNVISEARSLDCIILRADPHDTHIQVGDQFLRCRWWRGQGELWLATDQLTLCVRDRSLEPAMIASAAADPRASNGEVRSPMNARVSRVLHAAGDSVAEGTVLVTLEAMKIEHQVVAPLTGRLRQVDVAAGGQVQQGALLLVIEPGTS
jgi:acetyl/propionyl-CoA carboxylase alpha subunit